MSTNAKAMGFLNRTAARSLRYLLVPSAIPRPGQNSQRLPPQAQYWCFLHVRTAPIRSILASRPTITYLSRDTGSGANAEKMRRRVGVFSGVAIGQRRGMVVVTQTGSLQHEGQKEGNATTSSQPSDAYVDVDASGNKPSDDRNETLREATVQITDTSAGLDEGRGEGDEGIILVTASCAARIRQLALSRPDPGAVYLRVYVDAGGCSGFQYKFELLSEGGNTSDDEEDDVDPDDDVVFEKDGTRVVLDRASLNILRGSTIDYVQEMIRSSFAVVDNPQSESACGCGSSFAVKNFDSNPALD